MERSSIKRAPPDLQYGSRTWAQVAAGAMLTVWPRSRSCRAALSLALSGAVRVEKSAYGSIIAVCVSICVQLPLTLDNLVRSLRL